MRQRLLPRTAHLLRTAAKHMIYLGGCLAFKPFLLWRRRRMAGRLDPSRVLYVGLAQRGDFVLVLPTLIELKRRFPSCHITCWIRGFNRPLAALSDAVDRTIVYDDFNPSGFGVFVEMLNMRRHAALRRDLRSRSFTLMIDDSGSGFTTVIGAWAGIRARIGRNSQGFGFLNHYDFAPDDNCQLISKRLKLLRPLGIASPNQSSICGVIQVDKARSAECLQRCGLVARRYFTVQPNGGWRAKNWPASHMATVVAEVSRRTGWEPVLVGSNTDRSDLDAICATAGVRCLNLAGQLELDQLAALIGSAALHVGVDSVGSHLACALGTRSVTMFGPTNPRISHVFSDKNIAVLKRTPCTPPPEKQYCCFDAGRTCPDQGRMNELLPDEVLTAACDLLHARTKAALYEF